MAYQSNTGNTARPTAYLANIDKDVADSFDKLRDAVMKSGPMDLKQCELIIIAGLAAVNQHEPFKTHTRRLINWGVPKKQIQQAILCCMGASLTFPQTSNALHLIDDLFAEQAKAAE